MKDFLKESFPNPERKGCPEEDTLQALAEDRLPPNDPVLLHVGSCSECYREYLHFRQDFEEAGGAVASPGKSVGPVAVPSPVAAVPSGPVKGRSVATLPHSKAGPLATAAALVLLLGGGVMYLRHAMHAPSTSGALVASTSSVEVPVDLYGAVTTRGVGEDDATPIQQVSLPAAIVHLSVTLPRYSQTGQYEILVSKDRAGHESVAKGVGMASEENGKVHVPVTLDLRSARPGAYFLATVRGSDNGTYYYPLQVK